MSQHPLFNALRACSKYIDENIKEDVLFQHQDNDDLCSSPDSQPPPLPAPRKKGPNEEDIYEKVEVKKPVPDGMTFYKKPVKKVAF